MGDEEEKEPKRIQTCRLGPRCVSFFFVGYFDINVYFIVYSDCNLHNTQH